MPELYPTIVDAKNLVYRYLRRGVIILTFDGRRVHTASYGMTRGDCERMRDVSEQIHDLIACGEIEMLPEPAPPDAAPAAEPGAGGGGA